jgi:Fur family ferric uptake transcriptional regulator
VAAAGPQIGEFSRAVIQLRPGCDVWANAPSNGSGMTASATTHPLEFDSPKTVLNALRGAGLRVSTARRVVVQTLFAAGRPLSAEEIAGGIDGRWPPVDLASVYRNLETLEELGVVRHFHAGHGPGRYLLTGGGEHEFLACERCGALAEVDPGELAGVRAEVRERVGYEVRFTHFPMIGLCPECALVGGTE